MQKRANQATKIPGGERRPAATRDVVNSRRTRPRIAPEWARHYRHLRELREHFLTQRGALARDAGEEQPGFSEHMADAATDSFDRDFALSLLSSDQNALYEIEAALRRIETGGYGVCELTGKPIPAQRLATIPWARFSAETERKLEQQGEVSRARLGKVGTISTGEFFKPEESEDESDAQ